MPIFRSQHQMLILGALTQSPQRECTQSELATSLGIAAATISDEVHRLCDAGIATARSVGRSRLIRFNTEHPAAQPLAQIVALTVGVPAVIESEFGEVDGVAVLAVFGSWAARYHGHPGPPPADVDVVVVVEDPESARPEIYKAADRAQARVGIAVNPVVRQLDQWIGERSSDPLLTEIDATPVLVVFDRTEGLVAGG